MGDGAPWINAMTLRKHDGRAWVHARRGDHEVVYTSEGRIMRRRRDGRSRPDAPRWGRWRSAGEYPKITPINDIRAGALNRGWELLPIERDCGDGTTCVLDGRTGRMIAT